MTNALDSRLPRSAISRRLILGLALLMIVSITPAVHAVGTTVIKGTIVDPLGRPLQSVSVWDGSKSSLTNASGYYELEQSGLGPFTITAGRTGLNAQSRTISLTQSLEPLNFSLNYWQSASNSPSLFNSVSKTITLQTISYSPADGLCAWAIDVRTGNNWIPLAVTESHPDGWHRWSASLEVPSGTSDGTYAVHYRLLDCSSGIALAPESIRFYQLDTVAPQILTFGSRPNPFSPNGDGIWDRAEIGAQLGEGASWNLQMRTASGSVLRQVSGYGGYASLSWDGKDSTGGLAPAGSYEARLDVFDAAGNHEIQRTWVTLGSGPKIITLSTAEIEVGRKFSILGSGFGQTPVGQSGVSIDGVDLVVNSWSDSTIDATISSGVGAGTHNLAVWAAGVTSPSIEVTVKNSVSSGGGGFALCGPRDTEIYMNESCKPNLQGDIAFKVRPGQDGRRIAAERGDNNSRRAIATSSDDNLSRWFLVPFKGTPQAADQRISLYAADHRVEWAEFQGPYRLQSNTGDPLISQQWGLESAQVTSTSIPSAWNLTKGDPSIEIAIVDSGIGPHPDLEQNILTGRDYTDSGSTTDGCVNTTDYGSHGTKVAGLAAAASDNGIGIAGVAPLSKVRAYKVFNEKAGKCDWSSSVGLATVINDAVLDGNDVINLSFGVTQSYSGLIQDAIDNALAAGVVVVAAAGNNATSTVSYPGGYRHVIAVGSYGDQARRKAPFSNEGEWVDIYAPGAHLSTTVIDPVQGATYTTSAWGTSFSTPMVSGVAALLKACALSQTCRNQIGATSTVFDAASFASAITSSGQTSDSNQREAVKARLALSNMYQMSVRHPDGTFLRDQRADRHTIYFLDRGERRPIMNHAVAASWGLYFKERVIEQQGMSHEHQVVKIEGEELERYPTATVEGTTNTSYLGFRPGSLITPTGDLGSLGSEIFAVTNDPEDALRDTSIDRWTRGTKRSVLALFGCLGYQMTNVFAVDPKLTQIHKTEPPVSSCTDHPNGTVLRRQDEISAWIKERDPDDPQKSVKRLLGRLDLAKGYFEYATWIEGDRLLYSWGFQKSEVVANSFTNLEMADPTSPVAPGIKVSPLGEIGYRPGTKILESGSWWVVGLQRTKTSTGGALPPDWRGDFAKADRIEFTGDAWGLPLTRGLPPTAGCYRYTGEGKVYAGDETARHWNSGELPKC